MAGIGHRADAVDWRLGASTQGVSDGSFLCISTVKTLTLNGFDSFRPWLDSRN
jgi:hypothetical protein